MAKQNLRIPQLAKLRQFKKGDDIGQFLGTQFRQIVRAIEESYVNQDVSTSDLLGMSPSIEYSSGYDNSSWSGSSVVIGTFSMNVSVSNANTLLTVGLCQDPGPVVSTGTGDIFANSGYLDLWCVRTNTASGETSTILKTYISTVEGHTPSSSLFSIDKPGIGNFTYAFYGYSSATAQIRYTRMYIRTN